MVTSTLITTIESLLSKLALATAASPDGTGHEVYAARSALYSYLSPATIGRLLRHIEEQQAHIEWLEETVQEILAPDHALAAATLQRWYLE